MYENDLIITECHIGNKKYKYSYNINAFPSDQILYSNKKYIVGDTIKITNPR